MTLRVAGWKGVSLLFLSMFAVTRGIAYFPGARPEVLPYGVQLLTGGRPTVLTVFAVAWLVAAVCALVGAFMARHTWAWAVVFFMTCMLGVAYLGSWLYSIFGLGEPNREWMNCAAYLGPAGFIYSTMRLHNAPLKPPKGDR